MPHHLLQSPSFELSWLPQRGIFRLESPGRYLEAGPGIEFVRRNRTHTITSAELTAGRAVQEKMEDAHGEADELQIYYQETLGLAVTLRIRLYTRRPFVLFELSIANVGTDPVRLRRLFVMTPPGGITTAAAPSGFYVNGWQSWSPSGYRAVGSGHYRPSLPERWLQGPMIHNSRTPRARQSDRFWSETVGAVVTPREALIGGIASTADQFGQMWADLRPGHLQVMLQTQLDDIPLAVGESRRSEWYYLEWVPLPNEDPFAQYSHAVARQMSACPKRPTPTGWCSWYMHGSDVSESVVMENLASAALLADEMPLQVLQLDDGYQSAWGDWASRNDRFPHSLSWLADRIHGSGFDPGLWLAPLIVERSSQIAHAHPDWLLRGNHGRPVKAGLLSSFFGRALDPSNPEVIAFIRDVVKTAVDDWGYTYLKLDFMYAGALRGRRHDPQLTRAQALRRAFQAIREAAGPDTYLVGCGAPLGPAVGLVDAMRIGPDTAPSWAPDFRGLGRFVVRNPALPSLRNSLHNVATRAWMHGRWWANDPDALLMRDTKTALTDDEVLAQTTLLGLCSGLSVLSDDLDDIAPERRALASTLMPPLLDGMDVLDLFGSRMPELAVVPVARPWGRWRLIALFNWTETPVERELPDAVTLDERKAHHVVDFWERRYFLMVPGAPRPVLHIPAHGTVLLGIRQVKAQPHLVASTFHISQGAEITRYEADEDSLELELAPRRLATGAVWLALPARPTEATLDGTALPEKAIHAVASGVWSVTCRVDRVGTLTVAWKPEEPRADDISTQDDEAAM